ncbi:hypothetical protein LQG66_04005 [Bradyrhizobium ontarionense]|uniref:SMODS and SLOG-associating 2TM effector domain-containing protein n=1 Tax=Bradyrhizobium ontarionense TaxID=2898149 RepID=A0ABY3RDM8_9BRAD|nr:hypothetical protein [Bradyrhizobium sp. A19]UFZ05491.1 hypothetical protein LQG66_04005 [Bradyrhizobium sp. A19]
MSWLAQKLVDLVDAVNGFTADIFWQAITSTPVLVIIAAVAVVSFAVAHFPFVDRLYPPLAAFEKAASIVAILAFAALLYLVGYKASDTRAELKRVKNDLVWTQFQLGAQERAAEDAETLKREADASASDARGKLSEYQAKFGDDPNAALCRPRAGVVEWVHQLQRRPHATGGAFGARRGAAARLRATGEERR